MSPEELAAIRGRRGIRLPDAPTASEDIAALLAEVERLAREEQSLHGRLHDSERTIAELSARNRTAQARLDKVRALHHPEFDTDAFGAPYAYCEECSDMGGDGSKGAERHPCPTIQALDGCDQ